MKFSKIFKNCRTMIKGNDGKFFISSVFTGAYEDKQCDVM